MIVTPAEQVHYTPDDPANCRPTSGLTCEYCRNRGVCDNVMPRDDITSAHISDEKNTIPIRSDEIDEPKRVHDFTSN